VAGPAEPPPELPRDPHVVPRPDPEGEARVPVRPWKVPREGPLLGEPEQDADPLARDPPLGPSLSPRHGGHCESGALTVGAARV